jgi:uracil DNA glycosylase
MFADPVLTSAPAWSDFWMRDEVGIMVQHIRDLMKLHKYQPDDPFRIFTLIGPDDVRALIVGHSPYPSTPDDIAFAVPATCDVDIEDTYRADQWKPARILLAPTPFPWDPTFRAWIDAGIMLINADMITLTEWPLDITDVTHEFVSLLVAWISERQRVAVALLGSRARLHQDHVAKRVSVCATFDHPSLVTPDTDYRLHMFIRASVVSPIRGF